MEFKDRLKKARKLAGLNQAELAKKIGVQQTSISDLERGKSKSTSFSTQMAHELGVSALWLATGKGEMVPSAVSSVSDSNVSMAPTPMRYYRYPVISSVQAGKFAECVVPYPSGMEEQHESTDYDAKGPAFWLEVSGDSMTAPAGVRPSITEGTLVLVDTGIEATPGKLVVAQLDESNEATFKKYIVESGQKYLKPLNPAYPLIPINGNCRILGVAVEAKTKL
ncbi:LexA family protein [Vreelandella venusta]|uniref:LexA family protein n=1 Tax=Vreelandella venusta TaxID=44935 RepID=UPI0018DAF3AD|nr:LexA family transcriptional regulator [Halomonas venusta]QPI65855.1 helix-turn-helix domain-containing protein [Halomonas venusta]UQI42495.1 helix-turn-helix domain-containing protein [Halomonas venusta]